MFRLWRRVAVALLLGGALAQVSPGSAVADAPGIKRLAAPAVSLSAAWTNYTSGATHTDGPVSWSSPPPEISALARSLGGPPAPGQPLRLSQAAFAANVRDYIRNNIAVEYRFGLGKGARGAVIDQSGTPFDQAELMVQILKAGGVSADLKVGTLDLTSRQFGLWTGLVQGLDDAGNFTVNAKAACQLMADGGIPVAVGGVSDCTGMSGSLSSISIAHVWVSVGGTIYDPSYKQYVLYKGMDIATAADCGAATASTCGQAVTQVALNGATRSTVGVYPSIQGVKYNDLAYKLQTLSHAVDWSITNNGIERIEKVVGGRGDVLPDVLPFSSYRDAGVARSTVPDAYRTRIKIWASTAFLDLFADDLVGKRLMLGKGTFYVDDAVIGGFAPSTGDCSDHCPMTLTIGIDHPYPAQSGAYGDETQAFPIVTDYPLQVAAFIGSASEATARYYASLNKARPTTVAIPYGGITAPCTYNCGAQLAGVLAEWNSQQSQFGALIARMAKAEVAQHHTVGVAMMRQLVGYAASQNSAIPTPLFSLSSAISVSSNAGDSDTADRVHDVYAITSSALEGGVLQQVADTFLQASTGAAFYYANLANIKFLYAAPGAAGGLIQHLSDYSDERKSALGAAAAQSFGIIAPQRGGGYAYKYPGQYTINKLAEDNGTYYFKPGAAALLINDKWKGGGQFADGLAVSLKPKVTHAPKLTSIATVDGASGALQMNPSPDIVSGAGDFPASLPFTRFYTSGAETTEQLLDTGIYASWTYEGADADFLARVGGGWTHNYAISARVSSDSAAALGKSRAVHASTSILSLYTLLDLFSGPDFDRRLTATFVGYWFTQQLVGNVVTIRHGPVSKTFYRLPDLTFSPANANGEKLVQTGERQPISDRGYSYEGVSFDLTGRDGDVIHFDGMRWIGADGGGNIRFGVFKPTTWTFPNGIVVKFNYVKKVYIEPREDYILQSVENNLGRRLIFTTEESWIRPSQPVLPESVGHRITQVTTEAGRSAAYALSDCPVFSRKSWYAEPSKFGYPATAFLACNTLRVTLPDQKVVAYSYGAGADSPDPPVAVRNPYVLRRWYSPLYPLNAMQTFVYDDLLRVASVKDANAHAWSYYGSGLYGAEPWKLFSQVSPLQEASFSVFDRRGAAISVTDPLGRLTTNTYDDLGRLVRSLDPVGVTRLTTYDVRGNPIVTCVLDKSRSGKDCDQSKGDLRTETTYVEGSTVPICVHPASCNRPHLEQDAKGHVTEYAWGQDTGLLSQILSPPDLASIRPQIDLAYSAFSAPGGGTVTLLTRKTQKISASDTAVTTVTYDPVNKLTLKTITVDPDGLALTSCYLFNAHGDLEGVTDPRAGACPAASDGGGGAH